MHLSVLNYLMCQGAVWRFTVH